MKAFTAAAILAASTSALSATPLEDAFDELSALVEVYSGEAVAERYCSEVLCNGYVGDEQINITWPENGWMSAAYYPYTDRAETQLVLCGTIIDFVTGLGAEASGSLAGSLMAETQSGSAETAVAGAEITATTTSSGKLECEARRPSPID